MLTLCKGESVVLASPDPSLQGMVSQCLAEFASPRPRLTTVDNIGDCVVAVRLLDPCLVVLDDAVHGIPGPRLVHEIHQARSNAPVVYLASRHTLELERQVRCEGVLFYLGHPHDDANATSRLADLLKSLLGRRV